MIEVALIVRAIPMLASLEILTSLDFFHKLGQVTDRFIQADTVQEVP